MGNNQYFRHRIKNILMLCEGDFYLLRKNHFSFRKFISKGIAGIVEDTLNLISCCDGMHDLKYTSNPPLLSDTSSLRGLGKPLIKNWAIGKDWTIFFSSTIRIFTLLFKMFCWLSNLFLIEFMSRWENIMSLEFLSGLILKCLENLYLLTQPYPSQPHCTHFKRVKVYIEGNYLHLFVLITSILSTYLTLLTLSTFIYVDISIEIINIHLHWKHFLSLRWNGELANLFLPMETAF